MPSQKTNFIIHSPSYDENSGGIIVLHKLCHVLNELGYSAFLYPNPHGTKITPLKKFRSKFYKKKFLTHLEYQSPIAEKGTLNDHSIVIYPETDFGNPLKANNVVRWLLHKPGFHTGEAQFGKNELIYFFDDYCIEPGFNIEPDNKLFVLSINPAYREDDHSQERSGSCYMMRKAQGRTLEHDLSDTVQIDGLSHSETAKIFQQKTYFYCYDEFTLYAQYAALCGCIPVVMPEKFHSREEWVEKHPISKYGIAYGMNDIEHAIASRHRVAEYFIDLEMEARATVEKFAQKTILQFGLSS